MAYLFLFSFKCWAAVAAVVAVICPFGRCVLSFFFARAFNLWPLHCVWSGTSSTGFHYTSKCLSELFSACVWIEATTARIYYCWDGWLICFHFAREFDDNSTCSTYSFQFAFIVAHRKCICALPLLQRTKVSFHVPGILRVVWRCGVSRQ